MSSRWPMVPLGEVLIERRDRIGKFDAGHLPLLGVSNEKGLQRSGMDRIADMSRYFRVERDWFAYNPMRINVGSIGWASQADLTGVISPDYVVVSCNENVLPPLVFWFLKHRRGLQAINAETAGSVRERLYFESLSRIHFPLPPIADQRRLVDRINALMAKISEAQRLKRTTQDECRKFWKVLSKMARSVRYPERPLEDVAEFLDGRRIPLNEAERTNRKGSYPYYGASGIIDYVDDFIFDEDLLLLSEDGANLINRSTPIAFVARGKYWVNNHAHVLRPIDGIVTLHFLEYALSDFDVSDFNFASAQAKLNQRNARQLQIPIPPLQEQLRIVSYLNSLKAICEPLVNLEVESQKELEALLPAVLDQAFRGEL